jgi:tRNA A37 threonylcarbamoyladenosine dehydratase
MDDVCISNTNRQLHAMTSTVGRFKGDVLRDRIMDINPHATVNFVKDFVTKSNVDDYLFNNLTGHAFDFVIDAADGVADKASIIDSCVRSDTPVVVCGGKIM